MGKPLTKYRTHTKLKDEPLHDNEKQTSTTEHEKSQVCFQQLAQCSTSQTIKPIPLIKRSKGTSLVTLGGGTRKKNQHGHLRNMWKVVEFNQTPKIV